MIGGEHMKTRRLGKTGLMVSEIGFGGEWLERHTETEGIELIRYASEKGINMLDCWMADPKSRNIIGEGIKENRGSVVHSGTHRIYLEGRTVFPHAGDEICASGL